MAKRRVVKVLAWIGVPVALVGILVAVWDWDWFKPLVESRASAVLGRQVTLSHLHVRLGWTTEISADDVRIANPEGFPADPPFAQVPRLTAQVDVRAYLHDRSIVLPLVQLERPALEVLADAQGRNNYTFDFAGPTGEDASTAPTGAAPVQRTTPGATPATAGRTPTSGAEAGGQPAPARPAEALPGPPPPAPEPPPPATAGEPAPAEGTPAVAEVPPPPGTTVGGVRVGTLRIVEGQAHVALSKLAADFRVAVNTREEEGKEPTIVAEARGTYARQAITARLVGGALLDLRDAERPWPVEMQVANGPTRVSLNGTVRDVLNLRGADLRLQLAGPDLHLLEPLTSVPFPHTPPYQLAGRLDYAEGRVRFRDMQGRVGSSDLEGTLAVTPGRERPDIVADLRSRAVDLADLGGFVGATPGRAGAPGQTAQQRAQQAQAQASPRLLPDTPLDLPRIRAADFHVKYRAASVRGRDLPFDSFAADLDIVDGVITLHPVQLGVGTGRIVGTISLTPSAENSFAVRGDIEMRQLDVSKLLAPTGVGGSGRLGGVMQIQGNGSSLAQILGYGDGSVTLVMVGGDLSSLLVDLSGLQFGNALLSALGVPSRTRIECLIADFGLRRGVLSIRTMLLDTDSSVVSGTGNVQLAREILELRIRTEAKHFTVGALPTPIVITGTIKNPNILPDVSELAVRGAAAAGLAVLAPPLALLPTIQLGVGENNQCEAMEAAGRRRQQGGGRPQRARQR